MESEETTQQDEQAPEVAQPTPEPAPQPPGPKPAVALIKMDSHGIGLSTAEDLFRFAKLVVSSGLAPKAMTAEGAAVAIQAGMERGLRPMAALRALVVVNGNLSWRGEAAFAQIVQSPLCVKGSLRKWTEGEGDDMVGVATGQRVGYRDPVVVRFSVADAKRARLWGKVGRNEEPTPWVTYPGRMLAWRAFGDLAKDLFPDVLGGFATDIEVQDYEPQTTRGETPASRHAAGIAPPPGRDPLADIIDAEVVEP